MTKAKKLHMMRGFSIIEILIVLGLIALVVGLAAPKLLQQGEQGKVKAANIQIQALKQSLTLLNLDIGRFPTTEEGLGLLVDGKGVENWNPKGYVEGGKLPKDPWNRDYVYEYLGNDEFALYSQGKDGTQKIGIVPGDAQGQK